MITSQWSSSVLKDIISQFLSILPVWKLSLRVLKVEGNVTINQATCRPQHPSLVPLTWFMVVAVCGAKQNSLILSILPLIYYTKPVCRVEIFPFFLSYFCPYNFWLPNQQLYKSYYSSCILPRRLMSQYYNHTIVIILLNQTVGSLPFFFIFYSISEESLHN